MQSASIQFRFIKLIALKKSETVLDKIELCAERNGDIMYFTIARRAKFRFVL